MRLTCPLWSLAVGFPTSLQSAPSRADLFASSNVRVSTYKWRTIGKPISRSSHAKVSSATKNDTFPRASCPEAKYRTVRGHVQVRENENDAAS